jgi:hypothetical protein
MWSEMVVYNNVCCILINKFAISLTHGSSKKNDNDEEDED